MSVSFSVETKTTESHHTRTIEGSAAEETMKLSDQSLELSGKVIALLAASSVDDEAILKSDPFKRNSLGNSTNTCITTCTTSTATDAVGTAGTSTGTGSPKSILADGTNHRRELVNSVADYFEEEKRETKDDTCVDTDDKGTSNNNINDERYKPDCTGTSHLREMLQQTNGNINNNTGSSFSDDRYSLGYHQHDTRVRAATSADEMSEYVRKPQPHDETNYDGPGKLGEPEEPLSAVLRKYQYPRTTNTTGTGTTGMIGHNTANSNAWAAEQAQRTSKLFLRMSRQMRYGAGRRGSLPSPHRRANRIKLHIYDLIPAETVMQWGCMHIPIGRCFDVVNSSLHSMGTGAYHVGIDVNGIEYSYGATTLPRVSGVFSCMPKRSPGYQYRTTIDFGERTLVKKSWVCADSAMDSTNVDSSQAPKYQEMERNVEGREVIKEMAAEYMGIDYDLLRKNCVTFGSDACIRLGVKEDEIPTWFRNLCQSGAITQDVAMQTVEPIQNIFSACEDYSNFAERTLEDGFEVITKADVGGLKDVVMVVDAVECNQYQCIDCPPALGVRKTLSWTY